MSISFLALQCFQCSTMQVKQQKKSSNKWVCVVCNQRQSVQKIHARGPLAKDLRKFVQAFNMTRLLPDTDAPRSVGSEPDYIDAASDRPKRRMDWSEYLDPDQEAVDEDDDDGDEGVCQNETVLSPKVSFPKCPSPAAALKTPFKPAFSKKRQESSEARPGAVGADSKKHQKTTMRAVGSSRWSEYLEEDDRGEGLEFDGSSPRPSGLSNDEGSLREIRVEEEVHPDFM